VKDPRNARRCDEGAQTIWMQAGEGTQKEIDGTASSRQKNWVKWGRRTRRGEKVGATEKASTARALAVPYGTPGRKKKQERKSQKPMSKQPDEERDAQTEGEN